VTLLVVLSVWSQAAADLTESVSCDKVFSCRCQEKNSLEGTAGSGLQRPRADLTKGIERDTLRRLLWQDLNN
jgi:hypothetical protein